MATPWHSYVTSSRQPFRGWLDGNGFPHIRLGNGCEMFCNLPARQLLVWAPGMIAPHAVNADVAFERLTLADPNGEVLVCMHPFALLCLLLGDYLPTRGILETIRTWQDERPLQPVARIVDPGYKLMLSLGLRRAALLVATDFDYSVFFPGQA